MMMMHSRPTGHTSVFPAVLMLAPLVRGPWQAGFCTVVYMLHAVLTCCAQPVTDYIGMTSLSTAAFRCSVRGGDGGIARCTLELATVKLHFCIPLGN